MKKKLLALFVAIAVLLVTNQSAVMATVATTNVTNTGTGDGVTTTFPFTFRCQTTGEVMPYLNGVLQTTGFTVSRLSSGVGGNVVFSVAPASGVAVLIQRTVPLTQALHLTPDGVWSATALENAYDKAIMAAQQIQANGGGVTSVSPGLNVTITGTPQNPIINVPGGSGAGFISSDQVITTNGTLTLPHGLGSTPSSAVCALVCQTAEFGYSIGDITFAVTKPSGGTLSKFVADATNVNVTYGSGTAVFGIFNKSTLAAANATNANWKMRVFASIGSGGGGGGGSGGVSNVSTVASPSWLSSTWANPSTTPAQTLSATTIPIAAGGTNNGSLSVTAGTVYYADGTKIVGLAPGTGLLQMNGASPPTIVSGSSAIQSATVNITSANFLALNTTGVPLVASPGAGHVLIFHGADFQMTKTSTGYGGGGTVQIEYTTGNVRVHSSSMSSGTVTGSTPGTADNILAPVDVTGVQNSSIQLHAATANFTSGTGTAVVTIYYAIN